MDKHSSLFSRSEHGLSGQNQGRDFNFRHGSSVAPCIYFTTEKLPNSKLKTGSKQLLGSLLLTFALPGLRKEREKEFYSIDTRLAWRKTRNKIGATSPILKAICWEPQT